MTLFWSIAGITLLLDRAAKWLVQSGMKLGEHITVLRGLLELRYTHNTGMALGFLAGHAVAGILLPLLAMVVGVFVFRKFRLGQLALIGAALVFGGFLGNFLDRLFLGYVVDMVFFPWLPYFICNPADIAITVGAVLLGISLLFRPKDWQDKKEATA